MIESDSMWLRQTQGVQSAIRNESPNRLRIRARRSRASLSNPPLKGTTSMDHVNPGKWLFSPAMLCQFETHQPIVNIWSVSCIKLFKWHECDMYTNPRREGVWNIWNLSHTTNNKPFISPYANLCLFPTIFLLIPIIIYIFQLFP